MTNTEKIRELLKEDCSPFVNPMGASATFINNKVSASVSILNNWDTLEKAAKTNSQSQQGQNGGSRTQSGSGNQAQSGGGRNTQQEQIKPYTFLSMAGINVEDIETCKKCLAQANKVADVGRNYGAESNNDFLAKMTAATTYLGHLGLSSSSSSGCNVISSLFTVGAGLGKALLSSLGVELGSLNNMLSNLNNYVEQAMKYANRVEQLAKNAMQAYSDIKNFIANIDQKIKDIENQLKSAIQAELDNLANILAYNARMTLSSFLGSYASDPCISGVINSISSDRFKRLF